MPYRRNKIIANLFILLVAVGALPVIVSLVKQMQNIRSKAAVGNTVLSIEPATQNKNVGQTGSFNIFMNPNGNAVTGLEIYMTYDNSKLDITGISPSAFFTDPAANIGQPVEIKKTYANGTVHYAIGFPLGSKYSSTSAKNAVTVSYTAKAAGTASLTFVTTGAPKTTVSDTAAQNVLLSSSGGNIIIASATSPTVTPSPLPGTLIINDNVLGTNLNQFDYFGSWTHWTGTPNAYLGDDHTSTTANDYVLLRFSGSQIQLYGAKDPNHGIGSVSVDGGSETTIDYYSSARSDNTLLWTSPTLSTSSAHTLKLRVTGGKNNASTGYHVAIDRVVIYANAASITPTATPLPTSALIPGDINKDGKVDIFDYNLLVTNYGATDCGNVADINKDCKVDIFDYNILVTNYGV